MYGYECVHVCMYDWIYHYQYKNMYVYVCGYVCMHMYVRMCDVYFYACIRLVQPRFSYGLKNQVVDNPGWI